jgi:hypothetical protein
MCAKINNGKFWIQRRVIMLVVKVWGLPAQREKKLKSIHRDIVRAICGIEKLQIDNQSKMMVLFHKDMMRCGLGREILIEAMSPRPTDALNRMPPVKIEFNKKISDAIKKHFPSARVQCSTTILSRFGAIDCYTTTI